MLFPLFVIVTLLEIYVLVSVGEEIGGFKTILLVIVTALIGSTLLKQQRLVNQWPKHKCHGEWTNTSIEMMEVW
jgi:Protein affecting phage T7 exclusion by the F plasmid